MDPDRDDLAHVRHADLRHSNTHINITSRGAGMGSREQSVQPRHGHNMAGLRSWTSEATWKVDASGRLKPMKESNSWSIEMSESSSG